MESSESMSDNKNKLAKTHTAMSPGERGIGEDVLLLAICIDHSNASSCPACVHGANQLPGVAGRIILLC